MDSHVVLAYSGGLDTSYCVVYFNQVKKLPVHTVTVNTGGFSKKELVDLEKKALELGAQKHVTIDAVDEYYQNGIRYLVYGNVATKDNCLTVILLHGIYNSFNLRLLGRRLQLSKWSGIRICV